jgi:hypothetical protein
MFAFDDMPIGDGVQKKPIRINSRVSDQKSASASPRAVTSVLYRVIKIDDTVQIIVVNTWHAMVSENPKDTAPYP